MVVHKFGERFTAWQFPLIVDVSRHQRTTLRYLPGGAHGVCLPLPARAGHRRID